ncbi:hypothetical protein BASA81_004836 [Batrachochytrium salamandrivorans]|nr:hypothetical protein BASA81_004836 [Batrachochytrium salamandrivorans]
MDVVGAVMMACLLGFGLGGLARTGGELAFQHQINSELREQLPMPQWGTYQPMSAKYPKHVMFSTRRKFRSKFESLTHHNARMCALNLSRTNLLLFEQDNPKIRKNFYGFVFLKDMFLEAQRLVPDAATYTYFNDDLLFNQSFIHTLDTVVLHSLMKRPYKGIRINKRFMVMGLRTNVNWTREAHSRMLQNPNGTLFVKSAQDYFACSRGMWDWSKLPDFVVGRVGYDNWLVENAVTAFPEVISVIDASLTNQVIHQTDPRVGDYQGHSMNRGPEYNVKLAGLYYPGVHYSEVVYPKGMISSAPYSTTWGENGTISIQWRD